MAKFKNKDSLRELRRGPEGPNIFFISDTHFGDDKKLARRPFDDVESMNKALLDNWNSAVGNDDFVYFLGDIATRESKGQRKWLGLLNGNIIFIRGNNDSGIHGARHSHTVSYGGKKFYLIHDPEDAPKHHRGGAWIVHGHKHNKYLEEYPFINGANKHINVSVEVIGFRPVSIDTLLSLKLKRIRRMDTLDSEPVFLEKVHA